MGFSAYTANAVLNSIFSKTSALGALASAPTIYVALFTSDPEGTANEANYTEYARVQTAASDWASASGRSIDNAEVIEFPMATGGSNDITHFALFDAATGGNLILSGTTSSLAVSNNIQPRFASGQLTTTLN